MTQSIRGTRPTELKEMAMNHQKHTYLMIGLAVVGGVLLITGTWGGGAFTVLWLAGCAAMMFFMMRGMGGMSHGGASSDDETRDKVDHKH